MVDFIVGETVTGRILATLPIVTGRWSAVLNQAGNIEATIPLSDPSVASMPELRAVIEPWRIFLGARVGARIIEAGPILAHDYDDPTQRLTLKAAGLGALFGRRLVTRDTDDVATAAPLAYTGLSLRTIAKRLVERGTGKPGAALPVVPEDDITGGHERTYDGYELGDVTERLTQLSEVQGGPDIAFEPRLTSAGTHVEWVVRTGTPLSQVGDAWRWDVGQPKGGVGGLSVSLDASQMTSKVFVTGQGFEQSMLVGVATDSAPWARGYPLLESAATYSQETSQANLDAHAARRLAEGARPRQTWKLQVQADTYPMLGEYRPGDRALVTVPASHPYLTPGPYETRIGGLSGDETGLVVHLDLEPTEV
ncbi:MAG TPA: hypothetical protein VIO38_09155 [Rariglobus sp.]